MGVKLTAAAHAVRRYAVRRWRSGAIAVSPAHNRRRLIISSMSVPPRAVARTRRALGVALATAGAIAIAALTLMPAAPFDAMPFDHWCLLCGSEGTADFVANILLFVPLGLGLGFAGVSWRRATVIAAAASTSIELAQYFIITGRFATLGDVVSNTIGGSLGAMMA